MRGRRDDKHGNRKHCGLKGGEHGRMCYFFFQAEDGIRDKGM